MWAPCHSEPSYVSMQPSITDAVSCRCERRVQAARTVRPAPPRSGILSAPQRAPASRLARSGEQRSGAPHAVLGLDDKPRGAILPDRLGGMASASAAGDRRAPREAQRGQFFLSFARPTAGRRRAGRRADWVSRPSTLTGVDSKHGKEIDR